jgi:transposase
MAAGRPTDYKPEYCKRVIELGKTGASIVEMAAEIGVDRKTLETAWPAAFPEFLQAFTQAKQFSQVWWEKVGREGMFESPGGGKINATIWSRSMAARFPADWREASKVENTLQNPDGTAIDTGTKITIVRPPKRADG